MKVMLEARRHHTLEQAGQGHVCSWAKPSIRESIEYSVLNGIQTCRGCVASHGETVGNFDLQRVYGSNSCRDW